MGNLCSVAKIGRKKKWNLKPVLESEDYVERGVGDARKVVFKKLRMLTEKVEIRNKCDWSRLPDIVLNKVFYYLPNNDRLSASRVCRQWFKAFHSPNLWREIVVNLEEATFRSLQRMLLYANWYGRHLRSLEINYPRKHVLTLPFLETQLTTLFEVLHACRPRIRLNNFRFRYFFNCRQSSSLRHKFLTSICRFLRTQRSLSEVEISHFQASVHDGIRLLGTVAQGSGSSLRTLILQKFIYPAGTTLGDMNYQVLWDVMADFKHLEVLGMSYNAFSEEAIACLKCNYAGRLRLLSIECNCFEDVWDKVLDNEVWKELKRASPDLLVDFEIEKINDSVTLMKLLSSDVPLRILTLRSGKSWFMRNNMEDLINFIVHVLTNFQTTLAVLNMTFGQECSCLTQHSIGDVIRKLQLLLGDDAIYFDTESNLIHIRKSYGKF